MENFTINDVTLEIDPVQISVYKEGLTYSWKTLRTKASSKITSGNGVFHLKLNLIFKKDMFLSLHRLICQMRNSPFVQIENELVKQAVSTKGSVFFTANSVQIIPRSDSPYTVDVELDLRYFNHHIYSGEYLLYKEYFETAVYTKGEKSYVKTFDVFTEGLLELEVNDTAGTNDKRINLYNRSTEVRLAKESFAYKRYSNYLQIKNLKACFGLTDEIFASFKDKVNRRDCLSLADKTIKSLTQDILDEVYIEGNYYKTTIKYREYLHLAFTAEETKALKTYFSKELKDVNEYADRLAKTEKLKKNLMNYSGNVTGVESAVNKIKGLSANEKYHIYTGRKDVSNVFFKETAFVIKRGEGNLASNYVLSNMSCGFTNMVSSIPISGQEFPAHQFLGSTEPIYNMNILGVRSRKDDAGLTDIAIAFEAMRKQLQKNTLAFKMVPDAGYFHVENFFTKLLGSHQNSDISGINLSETPRYILRNFNINTIEGAPGSQGIQFSFFETNAFKEEELKPVSKSAGIKNTTKKLSTFLTTHNVTQGRPKKNPAKESYVQYKWSSKYFTASDYYRRWETGGRKRAEIDSAYDKKAYDLCLNILDKVQENVAEEINIFSAIDLPKTGKRKGASRHYSGGAVDVQVKGMTPIQLMQIVANSELDVNHGVIGYYQDTNAMLSDDRKMKGYGEEQFFVHIDDRTIVKRTSPGGGSSTSATSTTEDTFTVTNQETATFYALDVNGISLVKAIDGLSVQNWLIESNLSILNAAPSSSDEANDELEVDIESALSNPAFRKKIESRISPFESDLDEKYGIDIKPTIVKVKDLSPDQKDLVQKYFSNNELNPELELRLFEGAPGKIEGLKAQLEVSGFTYGVNSESSQLYIPLNANNIDVAKGNREARALLDMHESLYLLANMMLTEPGMYVEDDEVGSELARIRGELGIENVQPSMLSNFLAHVSIKEDFITDYRWSIASVAGGVISGTALGLVTGGGGLLITLLEGAGAVLGLGLAYIDAVSTYRGKVNFARGLKALQVPIGNALNEDSSVDPKSELPDFYNSLGKSDMVGYAFQILTDYVVFESKAIRPFQNALIDVKTNLRVSAALGSYTDIVKNVAGDSLEAKAIKSETLFVGELKTIFNYYFGFPYINELFNEEDFDDLFKYNIASTEFEPLRDINQYIYSKGQYHIMDQGITDFPITKEKLKATQDLKIGYLKTLKDAILEALLDIPVVRQSANIPDEINIFELSGENAYPDIVLPKDPARENSNVNLHPTFFFSNSSEERSLPFDYINPVMKKNLTYIIGQSYDYEEALRKGIFTGSRSDVEVTKDRLSLDVSTYPAYNQLLTNGENPPERIALEASETNVTAGGTATNPKDATKIDNLIKEQKVLQSSFDNIFGDITKKPIPKNDSKNDGFKTKEDVVEEAISSSRELMRPKKNIKRAFPTYRLYLIEEDSLESGRLSIFDDFYSYSGVKSFTVFSHKNMPASTAVIQIQNISGVLDGTKPEVVRDIDIDQDLTAEEEFSNQKTVSSIVIRPGINIQLRAGYEANPNKLDIIFTGRITEVKNSSAGEVLEVTAQSFGIELIAKKLGLHPDDPYRDRKFYNTHSLLGSLMLSEELEHFGRVKIGRRFQTGEAKVPTLDIGTGKYEEWFNFNATHWISRALYENAIWLLIAAPVVGASRGVLALAKPAVFAKIASYTNLSKLFNKVPTFGEAGGLIEKSLVLTKNLFIDAPAKVFNKIAGSRIAEKQKLLAVVDTALTRDQLITGVEAIVPKLAKIAKMAGGETLSPKNAMLLIDKALISRYGYAFCISNNLLSAAPSAFQIVTGSTIGSLFGSISMARNVMGVFVAGLIIGGLIDALSMVVPATKSGVSYAYDWISGKYNPPNVKMLLGPQDDNIFPPPPEEYMVQKNRWANLTKSLITIGKRSLLQINTYVWGISGALALGGSMNEGEASKVLKNAYLKGDTRLSVIKHENEYSIQSSTIWEILHEMSLRHPGFLYGIRKYGNGLESRVFFGKSSQRYFSKDFSTSEIDHLNKIDAAIKRRLDESAAFPTETLKNIYGVAIKSDDALSKTEDLIRYWIEKTKERFVPYRKYHSLDSEHDIVNNGVRVDASKVKNQINVIFKDGSEDSLGEKSDTSTKIKAIPYIKESMISEKGINFPNCKGLGAASRYGISELANSAKQMYSGEILIVGNPKIDTDDICIITDDYLNMYGMVEVEAITHMFSHENGFLTEIIPNAVVYSKDRYISNIISGTLVFEAHRKLIDKYTRRSEALTRDGAFRPGVIEEVAREALVSYYTGSDSGIYNALYDAIPWVTDHAKNTAANKKAIEDMKEGIESLLKRQEIIFLGDITKGLNVSPIIQKTLTSILTTTAVAGTGVMGAAKVAQKIPAVNITRSVGLKGLVGMLAALAALKIVGDPAITGLENSVKYGFLGKNLFKDVLMTQVSHNNLIRVMPLVKDGKPLVAGGYEYIRQKDRFKEVFGSFFNPVTDNIKAFNSSVLELESNAELLGIREYMPSISIALNTIALTGEYLTSGAVSNEAILLQIKGDGDE